MKKYNLLLACLLFMITSCTHSPEKALNTIINKSSADEDVTLILENYKDIDSIKIHTLENLAHMSKGYDFYLNDLKTKKSILVKYIVNKETFNQVTDSVFTYFEDNKITYRKIIGEIDAMNRINKKYNGNTSSSNEKRKELELKFASRDWKSFNAYTLKLFKFE